MRVGVIASMKKGLEHFIFRELVFLEREGLAVSLFPTKYGPGLYDAQSSWELFRWRPAVVLALQLWYLLSAPVRYLRLLYEAAATGSVVDFMLAWYFSQRMQDVDVIYATFGDHKLFVGYFCKRILGTPLAVTLHAYELYSNPNPRLFRRALTACDQIITVTAHNRELLRDRFGIPSSRVELIPYSVDMQEYRPEGKFTILIAGFFVERKGHEVLFRAVKKLAQKDMEVWVVGGEGAEGNTVDVRALAVRLDLEDQVAFFGKLKGPALKALYRACDVFCLPCRTDSNGVAEGFPLVLVEAMAMGKPVITTRHVEIPRIIPEILVEENDVDGLAEAILRVYRSPALRARLGEQNRKLAVQTFSPKNASRTAQVLLELGSGVPASGTNSGAAFASRPAG
jgi:glycosyltransferase involved in cell wall biosynthesis